jgi:phytanoyl-CoA hydroxylase
MCSFLQAFHIFFGVFAQRFTDCIPFVDIFKQPHTGGEVTPHQDSSFMHTNPASCHALWIALDDATTENGCLWAIPGSHTEPVRHLFKLKSDKSGVYYDPPVTEDSFRTIWPRDKYVALPVKAGSCVVIHGQVIHMSEDNLSDKGRHVYTFHVVDAEAEWDRENWFAHDGIEVLETSY